MKVKALENVRIRVSSQTFHFEAGKEYEIEDSLFKYMPSNYFDIQKSKSKKQGVD